MISGFVTGSTKSSGEPVWIMSTGSPRLLPSTPTGRQKRKGKQLLCVWVYVSVGVCVCVPDVCQSKSMVPLLAQQRKRVRVCGVVFCDTEKFKRNEITMGKIRGCDTYEPLENPWKGRMEALCFGDGAWCLTYSCWHHEKRRTEQHPRSCERSRGCKLGNHAAWVFLGSGPSRGFPKLALCEKAGMLLMMLP